MKLRAVLKFDYSSNKEAMAVADALEPDNEGFVKTAVEGTIMKAIISAETPDSLRHTLDDFLACLRVAEEAVGIKGSDAGKDKKKVAMIDDEEQ